MAPSNGPPVQPPPYLLVRDALEQPDVQARLLAHARAILRQRMPRRPSGARADEARDAVQETQARALRRCHTYDPLQGSPCAWLHGILTRVLYETIRQIQGLPCQMRDAEWERLAAEAELRVAAETESLEKRLRDVRPLLDRLPIDHRIILELRFWDDLRYNEIALRLGITAGNARVRVYRALQAARGV